MLVIRNIGALITCEPLSKDPLGTVFDAAVVAADNLVSWYGPEADMPLVPLGTTMLDAKGCAVVPGLVDCHTHMLHVGDRSDEFASRARGKTYLQILADGGGILSTVEAVRRATEEQLVEAALPRLQQALQQGITSVEIKSGYGLSVADERKMLRALRILGGLQPVEILPTFLGAHAVPAEYRNNRDAYVDLVINEMLPVVCDLGIAEFCDVYVESGAFSVEQAHTILGAAQDRGLQPRLHANQFNDIGACALAAELQALSADHLEVMKKSSIEDLLRADVVATILPICEIYLGKGGPAPGRLLADSGLRVAVASDYNPGSANSGNLLLAATLAVTRCGLTVEEAIVGITRHAAAALGRDDIGQLHVGTQCDLAILDTKNPLRMISDMGANHVERVVKAGRLVYQR